jgi:hypothetical protein
VCTGVSACRCGRGVEASADERRRGREEEAVRVCRWWCVLVQRRSGTAGKVRSGATGGVRSEH